MGRNRLWRLLLVASTFWRIAKKDRRIGQISNPIGTSLDAVDLGMVIAASDQDQGL